MSIIALKVYGNKIRVASDGRCLSDDRIVSEDAEKIFKIEDDIIVGTTGLIDSARMFCDFIYQTFIIEKKEMDGMNNVKYIALLNQFKNWILEEFGWNDEIVKEFGGFLLVLPTFHGIGYFDDNGCPYVLGTNEDIVTLGSTNVYTKALIESGMEIEEAIKVTSKHYTTINDHVSVFEICRKS